MKKAGLALAFALSLALATPALVIAQDTQPGAPTSAAPPVTQDQIQQVKQQVNDQGEQLQKIQTVQGQEGAAINDLTKKTDRTAAKADEAGKKADGATTMANTANTNAKNAAADANKAQTSADNATTKLGKLEKVTIPAMRRNMRLIIIVGGIFFLLVIVFIHYSQREFITTDEVAQAIGENTLTKDEIKDLVSQEICSGFVKKARERVFYTRSQVPEMRQAWKDLREVDSGDAFPKGIVYLQYQREFVKDESKGYILEGVIPYRVTFDDARPIDGQTPRFYYVDESTKKITRVPHDDAVDGTHGLLILKAKQATTGNSNVTSIKRSPEDAEPTSSGTTEYMMRNSDVSFTRTLTRNTAR